MRWCGWGSANPSLGGVRPRRRAGWCGRPAVPRQGHAGVAATFALGAALTLATGAGLWALWATLTAAMTVRTALMSGRFRSGRWVTQI
ncbi:MAG: hypothetical protein IPH38_01150 [Candidatus Microthrix sp.]|nr:hypothetical protein [Candidatus Microthrix sp.]MBK7018224.1 hypothetical protein [Candidatus Microthrix sp.]